MREGIGSRLAPISYSTQCNTTDSHTANRFCPMSNTYSIKQLSSLESIEPHMLVHLSALRITNIGDLLAFRPFRAARLIQAFSNGLLERGDVADYLTELAHGLPPAELMDGSPRAILGLSAADNDRLSNMGVTSVLDLAEFAPFGEAEALVDSPQDDSVDPSAPHCVVPNCKKYTRNKKAFVSFFRDKEVPDVTVHVTNAASNIANLFQFGPNDCGQVRLGYSVGYQQDWLYCGIHLGEPQGSVSLFMGQDTQISVLDWRRMQSALRKEQSEVNESLRHTLVHQRAVDEVARATAEEHQYGATSAVGANAATAGSFVAAGAIVGGIGGGVSGALTGLVVGNAANAAGGAPTIAGAAIGTAVGSVAGAAAGSLVYSGATTLGFVQSDARGDRSIVGQSAQNIQQRTLQNSSSLRSFWSSIVSQSVQEEQQAIRTDRVTNHNRIHALNALYFEVLNQYRVNIQATEAGPILFLPFRPFYFDEQLLQQYWWIIRTVLSDVDLVLAMDEHFLTAQLAESPAEALAALPQLDEVMASDLTVEVNLNGSMLETLVGAGVFAILNAAGLVGAVIALIFEAVKRENVFVELLTENGPVSLIRDPSSTLDTNFVGTYRHPGVVSIASIRGIRITNNNSEFRIPTGIPINSNGDTFLDITSLGFEGAQASFKVKDKSDYTEAIPTIGTLENPSVLGEDFYIGGHRSKDLTWTAGDDLRAKFSGIEALSEDLEGSLGALESMEARLSNLLGFLNANKFGFTRMILQMVEREQLMCALEKVWLSDMPLTDVVDTNPIGFCGNHVVLPLKESAVVPTLAPGIRIDIGKLLARLQLFEETLQSGIQIKQAAKDLTAFLSQLPGRASSGNGSPQERALKQRLNELEHLVELIQDDRTGHPTNVSALTHAAQPDPGRATMVTVWSSQALTLIRTIMKLGPNVSAPDSPDTLALVRNYSAAVSEDLQEIIGKQLMSDELSLPSPAIFMEPVLSHAKGAELYDMRRNSHYPILEAPGIGTADPNTDRSKQVTLTPTPTQSSLNIQNVPNYPLSGALTTALGEAGKLDLSGLINTNASNLSSMLSDLSGLAESLAKASTELTGSAQEQAMDTAGDLAKQISKTIESSLPDLVQLAKTNAEIPNTPQAKVETVREAKRIDDGPGTKEQKKERKAAVGIPQVLDKTKNYQLSIEFLDAEGDPFGAGSLTIGMDRFDTGETISFNSGEAIPFEESRYFAPDLLTMESGRRVALRFLPIVGGHELPGSKTFVLPNQPELYLQATMKSKVHVITSTDAKTAVDTVASNYSYGIDLSGMLAKHLDLGIKFPFKIAEIDVNGGTKTQLDFGVAYNAGGSTSGSDTSGSTIQKTYEVRVPARGWDVKVNPN